MPVKIVLFYRVDNEEITLDFNSISNAEMVMKEFKGRFLSSKKNMEFISIQRIDPQKLEVRSIKRLNIAKGKLASVALSAADPSSSVLGRQVKQINYALER